MLLVGDVFVMFVTFATGRTTTLLARLKLQSNEEERAQRSTRCNVMESLRLSVKIMLPRLRAHLDAATRPNAPESWSILLAHEISGTFLHRNSCVAFLPFCSPSILCPRIIVRMSIHPGVRFHHTPSLNLSLSLCLSLSLPPSLPSL